MKNSIPRLVVSPGEPAGIGLDILLLAAQQTYTADIIAIGDPTLFQERIDALKIDVTLIEASFDAPRTCHINNTLKLIPHSLPVATSAGSLDTRNASYVLEILDQCVSACQSRVVDAMVTGPIQKSVLNTVYQNFSGHTEYLAEKTQTELPVMMLATDGLRVALATTHVPLNKVAELITPDRLEKVITVLHHDLVHHFGINEPKILIAGLNPHAGEDGHLGTEELELIQPVIHRLQQQGMQLNGPLPADTLFTAKYLDNADVVLCMYHDQGLPVLKYKGFGNAINITLGLPIIRTSVDHGTALDLAGSGKANAASMILALQTAIQMSQSRS